MQTRLWTLTKWCLSSDVVYFGQNLYFSPPYIVCIRLYPIYKTIIVAAIVTASVTVVSVVVIVVVVVLVKMPSLF